VNSPASSIEPERKPLVKKEPAQSEGEKRSTAKVSSTLMPESATVKSEPGSKSPSGHGKSPLRIHVKEEKSDSTDRQKTSEGGKETSRDTKPSQSLKGSRDIRSSVKRDRDDLKSQDKEKASPKQTPSPATTSRKPRTADGTPQEKDEDEREIKRRKTSKEGPTQVENTDRSRDRTDKSHESRDGTRDSTRDGTRDGIKDSSRDSGREKGEKERERERDRDRDKDREKEKEKAPTSRVSERKRQDREPNGDAKESKRHKPDSDTTAAAVTSDPPSKTASEADDKTKHKIIRLKPSATALQDRRKLRDPPRDQKELSRDMKVRDTKEARGPVSAATRSARERGDKQYPLFYSVLSVVFS
jgi:hypothetical protein